MANNITYGPKLGKIINANIGDYFPDDLRTFLRSYDVLVQGTVISNTVMTPPTSPLNGDAYIIPVGATGWTGGDVNSVAVYSTEITTIGTNVKVPGWEFYPPQIGWEFYVTTLNTPYVFNGSAWVAASSGYPGVTSDGTNGLVIVGGVALGGNLILPNHSFIMIKSPSGLPTDCSVNLVGSFQVVNTSSLIGKVTMDGGLKIAGADSSSGVGLEVSGSSTLHGNIVIQQGGPSPACDINGDVAISGPITNVGDVTSFGTITSQNMSASMGMSAGTFNTLHPFSAAVPNDLATKWYVDSATKPHVTAFRKVTASGAITMVDCFIPSDATAGNIILTLPDAVEKQSYDDPTSSMIVTANEGAVFVIKKTDASANIVTITPTGTETIDGAATYVLTEPKAFVVLQSDGANWLIIGISSSGGSTPVENEIPSWVVGDNVFNLVHSPILNSLKLYKNGQRLAYGTDFTLVDNLVTLVALIVLNDHFIADYRW